MSLAEIHARAERFQSRIERRNLIEYVAGASVVAMFSYFAFTIPAPIVQAGCVLIILGTLYVSWKLATLARAPATRDKDPAQSWADFHRAELVRQRDALRTVWSWYLAPFVPGILVFLGGTAFSPDLPAPFWAKASVFAMGLAFVAALFGAIGLINMRAAKRLDAEIAKLDRARQ